ncbi:MAG: DUF58 domain-containing protein [Deltaproteobacteria bacterium]|nr:DUF58 domain-containing protein [Deltaproteobacteria bacterium]
MRPSLSRAGRYCAWIAFGFVAAGSLRGLWPLVALGAILCAALGVAYLWFFPTAILLRQRRLEMAWWVPTGAEPERGDGGTRGEGAGLGGALLAGRPFPLRVLLRNRSPRAFGDATLTPIASPALGLAGPLRARVPRLSAIELGTEVTAHAAGTWHLHGAQLALGDRFGLFVIHAYFPNPLGCKVFPRLSATSALPALTRRTAALHERAGQHRLRLRGLGGELREIRDHAHGDPFKQIAWKATARTRRLMVRELERDVVMTHQLLLDVSPTMRGGEYGRAKLDYGIEVCAALARAAGESGDRVGLVTFDSRIFDQVKAKSGRPHERRLLEHLMELRQIVDEDLTDPTDGELCALVARYLRHQEGIDIRLPAPPELDDPRWADVVTGPSGDLFDLEALDRVVTVFTAAARDAGSFGSRAYAATPAMSRLRRFCRQRGIEIPYRRGPGRKALGLTEALVLAARPRGSQVLLLVSDLEGLGDRIDGVLRATRLAITRHRLLVIVPFAPAFAEVPDDVHARRVAAILAQAERRALEGPRRAIESLGVPVLVVGREDLPQVVLRRWEHLRGARRGGLAA